MVPMMAGKESGNFVKPAPRLQIPISNSNHRWDPHHPVNLPSFQEAFDAPAN